MVIIQERDFEEFLSAFMQAIKNIDSYYFQLPLADKEEPIYRERVYCYELYHQLRCILTDDFPYKLNGEVDKSGHPVIRSNKKPDFIVHKPGSMDNNLIIVEVKPITVRSRINELKEDIKTLKWFLDNSRGKYYRGICLIYGSQNRNLPENVKEVINNISDDRIKIIWNPEPNVAPIIID